MYKQSLDYPSILLRPHEISGHLETLTHWEFFVMMCGNLFTVLAGVDIQYQRQLSGMASLFERLGGEAAIGSVVDKFYELMMKDPVVNYYFANTDMTKQIQRQKEFITLVTGGPNHYHGQDMKTAHQKMKIGKKQFDATWGHLRDSLLAHGVSQGMITQVKQIFYSVQEQIVNAKEDSRTLYERLGGEGAISAVIDKFYEFMLADPITAPFFANTDMKKQSQSQKAFITMVTGGPNNYHGMDMKKAHQKFKIGKKEFDETWFNLQKALEFFKVPKGEVVQLKAIFYSVEQDVETVKNSLYDRLGGQAGISDIVEKFYEFMLNDPVTAPYFAHTDMDKQKRSQKEFIAKVTGGPDHYHGAGMKKAHQKLKIGKKEFDETWHNLHKALSFYKVPLPEIQELKGAFYSVESEVETVKKTLFERLGGEAAINAVVDKFYEYMLADPITGPFFAKTDMTKQRQSQKDFIIMVTGGPNNYHGMDMKKAHQKFKIGKKEFDETWHNLEKALHFFKAPSEQVSQLKSVFYSVESDVETVGENKTLYERLGGEGAISAVVDKFYEFMLADPIVSPFFMNTDMDKQRKRQKQFITMVTGGPCNYEGTDMKTAHQKFKIGRKEFDETWLNLHKALEFFKVPGKQVDQLKNVFYSVEKDVETVKQENQLVDVEAKGFSRKVLLGSNVGMFKAFMGDMGEQKKKQTQKKSLFERLGGQLAINAVVDKFYEFMLADPITAPFFANTDMKKQIQSQKDFITMVTGGPNNYHGMDMKKAHQKFKIGKKEFDQTWHNLEKSLHFFKVPSAQLNELKQVFYSVQSDVQTVKADKKPLYERLGGEGAISAVVDKFYEFMLADPITAPFFANTDMKKQIQSQKDFITMVTGGPNKYHGMDMKKAHEKFKIGKKEFDETWHNLHKALSFFKVPNAETDELKEVFYSVESDVLTV